MLSADAVLDEEALRGILQAGHSRVPVHRPGSRCDCVALHNDPCHWPFVPGIPLTAQTHVCHISLLNKMLLSSMDYASMMLGGTLCVCSSASCTSRLQWS